MAALHGRNIIYALQKKWTTKMLLAYLFIILAITIFFSAIAIKLFNVGWYILPLIFVGVGSFKYFFLYKRLEEHDITNYINQMLPQAEESVGLTLKPYESLNFFEKLQIRKVEQAISNHVPIPAKLNKKLQFSLTVLLIAIVASTLLYFVPWLLGHPGQVFENA